MLPRLILKFQSYQFRQINPDGDYESAAQAQADVSFNRINSGRSIPTNVIPALPTKEEEGFNRINSGRSIPTSEGIGYAHAFGDEVSIVSIQADQSRPIGLAFVNDNTMLAGFNRINSGRSIPTFKW